MPNTTITAADLPKGTVIRFQNSILRSAKLTVRISDDNSDVQTTEAGNTYAIVFGYRVRPSDYDVSFGQRKVYCVNVERLEIVRAAS